MEQYFFGPDQDLQQIKECIKHGKECKFYQRSKEQALCIDCKNHFESKMGIRPYQPNDSLD